jgi:hypothetical protein
VVSTHIQACVAIIKEFLDQEFHIEEDAWDLLIVRLSNMSEICHWFQTFWGLLADMLYWLHNYPTHQEVGHSCLFSRNGATSWELIYMTFLIFQLGVQDPSHYGWWSLAWGWNIHIFKS